ncbi:MAG: hypothetical protein KGR18_11350 [Acidobacteria bacterium]|nr:hypothetical protein [Acidobacteriota bacterium]
MAEALEHPYGIINVDLIKRWFKMEPGTDTAFWALNLMKYREVAEYADGRTGVSGREADDAYAPLGPLAAVGAMVAYLGNVKQQPVGTPVWDRVGIIRYPSRSAFLAMQERDDFKAQHEHKKAGMEFTVILSCTPESHDPTVLPTGDLVLLISRGDTDPFAELPGLTQVANFDSEGCIIGDGRHYDRARFVQVDDDAALAGVVAAAQGSDGASVLVMRSAIDNLVESVVTA